MKKNALESVLNTDSFDRRRFLEIYKMSPKLQEIGEAGKDFVPTFPSLQGDIWAALYKANPKVKEDVSENLQTNKVLMEQIMENEMYHKFRENTKLDDLMSAITSITMSKETLIWLKERININPHLQRSYFEMRAKWEQYLCQKSKKNENELMAAQEDFLKCLGESIYYNRDELSQVIDSALGKAKQIKKNMEYLISGLNAGSAEAELKKIPLRDQIALAEKLEVKPKVQAIAEWAGRFKQIARKKQKSKYTDSLERAGVGMGNMAERLLPTELAMYAHPATRLDFLRRFSENQTMIYTTGKETLGRGPIVLCLDQSGSMEDIDSQAKGFTLALMSIAKRQKRDFALILFDTRAITFQYPKGKITPNDMVQLATTFLGGGTSFYSPLKEAVNVISSSHFMEADLIFVTDGVASLTKDFLDEFTEQKVQKKFSVISVLLGHSNEETVRQFSDEVIVASTFMEAGERVFAI